MRMEMQVYQTVCFSDLSEPVGDAARQLGLSREEVVEAVESASELVEGVTPFVEEAVVKASRQLGVSPLEVMEAMVNSLGWHVDLNGHLPQYGGEVGG